jgi:hypothetical protein
MCDKCDRALNEYRKVERSVRAEYEKATAQHEKEQAWAEYLKAVEANHPPEARE